MQSWIDKLSSDFNYKIYSSIFRVLLYSALFIELIFNRSYLFFYLQELDCNSTSIGIIELIKSNYSVYYAVYLFFLVLGILGIGKHITAVVIWVLFYLQNVIFPYGIWVENILTVTLLFMCFIDSYSFLSLSKSKGSTQLSNLVSNLAVYSILIHLCFIYANNAIHKLGGEFWLSGQAVYFATQEYHATIFDFQKKLFSNLFISQIFTYVVLGQQFLFVPLVLFKKTRPFILAVTFLIHFTMGILLLLFKFQFIMIITLGFFFTDTNFSWFVDKKRSV
ncbi:MAG: hypothetical protein H6604_06755 [Flavobacteriales bacterium]|nr:hypothetical protein [Flavobacteriales bacterium]